MLFYARRRGPPEALGRELLTNPTKGRPLREGKRDKKGMDFFPIPGIMKKEHSWSAFGGQKEHIDRSLTLKKGGTQLVQHP